MFNYQPILLKGEDGKKNVGIVLDGVTARIDEIYDDNIDNEKDICIDYHIIDGLPDNIQEYESKLTKVLIHVIEKYLEGK